MPDLTFDKYQKQCYETAVYPNKHSIQGLIYTTLGLTGEAGEIANKVKKILRDHKDTMSETVRESLIDELGDVLWYAAMMAVELNINMEDVAGRNTIKLHRRLEQGMIKGSGDNR